MNLSRKVVAEALGTSLLLATVVGSGIMGERLAAGNVAIALLANTIATGAGLVALILTLGPISGAHFTVSKWLTERVEKNDVRPEEIGIFLRDLDELQRTECALRQAGLEWQVFDQCAKIARGRVSVGSMHLAKGLEFRAVAVMACDDGVLPSQERIESAADDSDLEEIYNTERHLLYVACTRARDFLHISGVKPASEFLDDLRK